MPDLTTISRIFALMGFSFCCIAGTMVLGFAVFQTIRDGVQTLIHNHRTKEEKPEADCCCKDCIYWDSVSRKCIGPCKSLLIPTEYWFCFYADLGSNKTNSLLLGHKDL